MPVAQCSSARWAVHHSVAIVALLLAAYAFPPDAATQELVTPASGFMRSADSTVIMQQPPSDIAIGWRCRSGSPEFLLYVRPRITPPDFAPSEPFTATFEFQTHGIQEELSWRPLPDPPDLGDQWSDGDWFVLAPDDADRFSHGLRPLPTTGRRGRYATRIRIHVGIANFSPGILSTDPAFDLLDCAEPARLDRAATTR